KKMLNEVHSVDFELTGSELIALLYESEKIKKHQPKYNRMRKAETFTHSVECFKDAKGILNLRVSESQMVEEPLVSYTSYSSARSRLEAWLEEKELCLRYCGLTGEEAVCF